MRFLVLLQSLTVLAGGCFAGTAFAEDAGADGSHADGSHADGSHADGSRADESPEVSASTLKRRGDKAMDSLRYAEAVELYEKALALETKPALYYNLGRAHEALSQYPRAIDYLKRFRAHAPPSLLRKVPRLDELIQDLGQRITKIHLSSNVNGARVLIRGKEAGMTPVTGPLEVNAGEAKLEAFKEDYLPFEKTLNLKGGTEMVVEVQLLRKDSAGFLEIHTRPRANVSIGGKAYGQTPLSLAVPEGTHALVAEAEGYESASTSVFVENGGRETVSLELSETPALYEKWWFWVGTSAVVAGVATTWIILNTEKAPDQGDISPFQIKQPLQLEF